MLGSLASSPCQAPPAQGPEVLFSHGMIAERIETLAQEIAARHPEDLLVVAVLRGSFIFAADLLRALHRAGLSPDVEFMQLASYHEGRESSGHVTITKDIESDVAERDVLLIDDVLESGRTLAFARELLCQRGARQVFTAVMVDKPTGRAVPYEADFIGFTAPDRFLVGYGMDAAHKFRQLPYIGMLEG